MAGAGPTPEEAPAAPPRAPSGCAMPGRAARLGAQRRDRARVQHPLLLAAPARRRAGDRGTRPFFYPLDAVREWNRLYGRRGFTQYQCVLPRAAGAAPLAAFLERLDAAGGGLVPLRDQGLRPRGPTAALLPDGGHLHRARHGGRAPTRSGLVDALNAFVIAARRAASTSPRTRSPAPSTSRDGAAPRPVSRGAPTAGIRSRRFAQRAVGPAARRQRREGRCPRRDRRAWAARSRRAARRARRHALPARARRRRAGAQRGDLEPARGRAARRSATRRSISSRPRPSPPALDAADARARRARRRRRDRGPLRHAGRARGRPSSSTRRLLTVDFADTVLLCEEARQRLLARGGGRSCVFSSVAGDGAASPSCSTAPPRPGSRPTSRASITPSARGAARALRQARLRPDRDDRGAAAAAFAGEPEAVARAVLRAIDRRGPPVLYTPRDVGARDGGDPPAARASSCGGSGSRSPQASAPTARPAAGRGPRACGARSP